MTEHDPTAIDPDEPREDDLPPKPPIENMPGAEGDDPPADEDETDVPDAEFIAPDDAAVDDSVDNAEQDERPS